MHVWVNGKRTQFLDTELHFQSSKFESMYKKTLISVASIILFLSAAFVQADNAEGETPEQGLQAILELYKAQDWEGLVKSRCLDTRHAGSKAAVEDLVASIRSQFSDTETLGALVASFEAALANKPRLESEGSVAIFSSERGSVRLSRMDNGAWGLRF